MVKKNHCFDPKKKVKTTLLAHNSSIYTYITILALLVRTQIILIAPSNNLKVFLEVLSPFTVSREKQTGFQRPNCHASDCVMSGKNKKTVKKQESPQWLRERSALKPHFQSVWCLLGLQVYLKPKCTSEVPPASTPPYCTSLLVCFPDILISPDEKPAKGALELLSTFEQQ